MINKYAGQADLPVRRWIAHPGGAALLTEPREGDVAVAVGPEGGFRADEVDSALAAGWRTVDLGSRILRVETAAIALAAWFSLGK